MSGPEPRAVQTEAARFPVVWTIAGSPTCKVRHLPLNIVGMWQVFLNEADGAAKLGKKGQDWLSRCALERIFEERADLLL